MIKYVKLAKSGNKYLYFKAYGFNCCIFENQTELIDSILEKLNISDPGNVVDMDYLEDKLNINTVQVFFNCWSEFNSKE